MSVFWLHSLSDALSTLDADRVTRMSRIGTLTTETSTLAQQLSEVKSTVESVAGNKDLRDANRRWAESYEELEGLRTEEREWQKRMEGVMGRVMEAAVAVKRIGEGEGETEDAS